MYNVYVYAKHAYVYARCVDLFAKDAYVYTKHLNAKPVDVYAKHILHYVEHTVGCIKYIDCLSTFTYGFLKPLTSHIILTETIPATSGVLCFDVNY